jgi:hypothetical protein
MSEQKNPIYIFHLFRKEGDSIILHPFTTPEKLTSALETHEVKARYGSEPRVETLTLLKNDLYRMVEMGVKKWVSDVRFIPKFIISAVIFVVVYFFLSIVIPDPIPVIDEVGIGLAIALVTYFLLGRRDIKSNLAGKRRLTLRTAVDRIVFLESPFVKSIEKNLHENESGTIEEIAQKILEPSAETELSQQQREEAKHFVRVCEIMFKLHSAKKDEKILRKYLEGSKKNQNLQEIRKWADSKKIDFPLYAVYKRCKQTVSGLK